MSPGLIAVGAAGGAVLLVTLADIFVTVFNYDGFTFLTARFQRLSWRGLRAAVSPLPDTSRDNVLSLGSAALLPATLVGWLALEISAFAMMYLPGLAAGSFTLQGSLPPRIGTAYYFSASIISSLAFGDVAPHSGPYHALAVVETIIGVSTVSLAVAYVLAALETLHGLNRLHGRVHRQATEPNRPATILARYFDGGRPEELTGLLQSLTEDLDSYDEGLRRYPVVFYFHARRPERAIPRVFAALGDLIELVRWGLPADQPLTRNPYLLALTDGYTTTVRRLRHSFVGPADDPVPPPLPEPAFWQDYRRPRPQDRLVHAFRALHDEAREHTGLGANPAGPEARTYDRYREWLPFHCRRRAFIDQITAALGYPQDVAR